MGFLDELVDNKRLSDLAASQYAGSMIEQALQQRDQQDAISSLAQTVQAAQPQDTVAAPQQQLSTVGNVSPLGQLAHVAQSAGYSMLQKPPDLSTRPGAQIDAQGNMVKAGTPSTWDYLGSTIGRLAMSKTPLGGGPSLYDFVQSANDPSKITADQKIAYDVKRQKAMLPGEIAVARARNDITSGSFSGMDNVDPMTKMKAIDLVSSVGGGRLTKQKMSFLLPSAVKLLESGKTIDDVKDSLRYAQESFDGTGPVSMAIQSMAKTPKEVDTIKNFAGDYIQNGDNEGLKEMLKRKAIDSYDVATQDQLNGKKRTIEYLDGLKNDLSTFKDLGGKTGWLQGTEESLMNKIGKTSNPDLKKIMTKITVATFNYRRAMSGVAFGEKENESYTKLFPSGKNEFNLNESIVDTLRSSFNGDIENAYREKMGPRNYDKIFNSNAVNSSNQQSGTSGTPPSGGKSFKHLWE